MTPTLTYSIIALHVLWGMVTVYHLIMHYQDTGLLRGVIEDRLLADFFSLWQMLLGLCVMIWIGIIFFGVMGVVEWITG